MHLRTSPTPPPLAFTFCSSCDETLLSWVLLGYCVTPACWIVEDRCVCRANVYWYPSAYDTVSTLWEKPQTPVIKSTSVSNNNVLYVTRFYVRKICEKNNTSQFLWKKKTPIGHQVVSASDEPASLCHLPYVAFTWWALMKKVILFSTM